MKLRLMSKFFRMKSLWVKNRGELADMRRISQCSYRYRPFHARGGNDHTFADPGMASSPGEEKLNKVATSVFGNELSMYGRKLPPGGATNGESQIRAEDSKSRPVP
jgi:hypothetical protein